MDLITPVLIGIALSMDCFAVSLAIGTAAASRLLKTALVIALCFGVFQTGMTLIGWAAGTGFSDLVTGFAPWLAFLLLALIGAKMIYEGFENEDEDEPLGALQVVPVLILSIATSIDALAVGVSFALIHESVLAPSLIIGLIAFLLSFAGVLSGMQLKELLGKRIEIAGGLILIVIGLNILITHIVAA